MQVFPAEVVNHDQQIRRQELTDSLGDPGRDTFVVGVSDAACDAREGVTVAPEGEAAEEDNRQASRVSRMLSANKWAWSSALPKFQRS